MNLFGKVVASGLVCGLVLASVSPSQAQDNKESSKSEGIIFRVENIKPVANDEGLTSQCEFYVTVFNRMNKEVKEVDMSLIWTDNVSAKYKVVNDSVQVEQDARKTKTVISTNVEMKDIAPHQQKSFKGVVDTDKCFLLFDQLEYRINECIAEGDKVEVKNSKKIGKGSCLGVFDYINSKNPEYYSEFKDIPESTLQQMAEEQKKQDTLVIDEQVKQTIDSIGEVSKLLDQIN